MTTPRLLLAPPGPAELAVSPELAILTALDTLLAMSAETIRLSFPELDLLAGAPPSFSPGEDHRDLAAAQDVLDLVDALRCTLRVYREIATES